MPVPSIGEKYALGGGGDGTSQFVPLSSSTKPKLSRRLTQFNFEVPFLDLNEVVSTGLGQVKHANQQAGGESHGGPTDAAEQEQQDAAAFDDEEEEDDDDCSEIGAEDIILKWVVRV